MQVKPIKTAIFKEGEDLLDFIVAQLSGPTPPSGVRHSPKVVLKENSVLVVTSKIVALAEKRTASMGDEKVKAKLIKQESEFAIETKYCWLTIKDGVVMASAGIDESNASGKFILLPKNSYKSAELLHKALKKIYKIKNLGILITDSRTIPLRAGIVGMALGYAGFKGIKDYRKKKDIFGRPFHFSRVDIADSLAAAAVLPMGEGNEQKPLALIEGAPIEFCDKVSRNELYIDPKDDMYRPLFSKLSKN